MASVDGITAAEAARIEGHNIVTAYVNVADGHLHLVKLNGTDLDVGPVADYDALASHAALTAAVHGRTGTLVGTTDAQTLNNKTLNSPDLVTPTIASFANALHTHGNDTNGGALAIGKADDPASINTLTVVNLSDGDPPKTMASLVCSPGRWLILANCEGVTLSAATMTRFSYDLKTSSGALMSRPVAASSQIATIDGGRNTWGWLVNTADATITYTIVKNGNGALITNSNQGSLIAIRMG